jgi:hypothetical protein
MPIGNDKPILEVFNQWVKQIIQWKKYLCLKWL